MLGCEFVIARRTRFRGPQAIQTAVQARSLMFGSALVHVEDFKPFRNLYGYFSKLRFCLGPKIVRHPYKRTQTGTLI